MLVLRCFVLAAFLSLAYVAVPSVGHAQQAGAKLPRLSRTGHVYLFRGLWDVFSIGMDELAYKIRYNGMESTVHQHTAYRTVAAQAAQKYRSSRRKEPIFIVGHSLGADAAIGMATELAQQRIPVTMLITYDAYAPGVVPTNVRHLINFHQYESEASPGARLQTASGFRGRVENVNVVQKYSSEAVTVDHFNIDSFPRIHNDTMRSIFRRSRRK